jgi:hypothetical protein
MTSIMPSTLPRHSVVEREPLPLLSSRELVALGAIWKRQGRVLTARFGGNSMRPAINPLDEVVLDCSRCDPAIGQVIARVHADRLLVHRVVAAAADGRWLLTRGDANVRPDPPLFARSEIIATVVAIREDGRNHSVPPAPRSVLANLVEVCCRTCARLGDGAFVLAIIVLWNPFVAGRILGKSLLRMQRDGAAS